MGFLYDCRMIRSFVARIGAASTLEIVVWPAAIIAIAMTVQVLGALLVLQELFNGVCGIFWAIGQAMVNGYTLYEDIFESKPPLIFLLASLSLRLTGSPVLGTVLHTALLLAVLAGTVWYAQRRLSEQDMRSPALLVAAFLFSSLVIRYLSRHPTAWAVEFYGLTSLCLYFLVLADTRRFTVPRITLLTLLLGLSVGMKESFIIVAVSGACVLCRSREQWIRGVLIPSVLTGIVGIVTLALLGSLGAYLSVYLPEMLGYYTQRYYMPFLMKGLVFDFVFADLAAFSPVFLVLCIGMLPGPDSVGPSPGVRRAYERWLLSAAIALVSAMLPAVMFFCGDRQIPARRSDDSRCLPSLCAPGAFADGTSGHCRCRFHASDQVFVRHLEVRISSSRCPGCDRSVHVRRIRHLASRYYCSSGRLGGHCGMDDPA